MTQVLFLLTISTQFFSEVILLRRLFNNRHILIQHFLTGFPLHDPDKTDRKSYA